jgi:hypothetical protein
MTTNPEPWVARNLRATRANPPGKAADDDYRRALYGASLEQFEQLLKAAESVDAAARPLPLFYALSQAGRAIVAARGESPDIDGHGLTEDRVQPTPAHLLHRRIKRVPRKDGNDAFGAVATATGSSDLVGSVELGAVWGALTDTYRLPEDSWLPDWRPVLTVLENRGRPAPEGNVRVQLWSMMGNPHVDPATTVRGRYPTIPPDARLTVPRPGQVELGPGNWIAWLEWEEHQGQRLEDVAPKPPHQSEGSRTLVPTLPGHTQLLSPLMTWWILLFGLSVFARYHPGYGSRPSALTSLLVRCPLKRC